MKSGRQQPEAGMTVRERTVRAKEARDRDNGWMDCPI
jgi:hypothetical protein